MSAVPNLPEPLLNHEKHHIETTSTGKHSIDARIDSPTIDVDTKVNGDNTNATGFTLHDTPVENFRPIKVIVIGAGYSGIYHGIRIPERIKNCELVIYEKNAGIGGTWYENRYPGCACDIPSHSYQYSFNPNPNWSSLYAPAAEIQAYIASTAKKYSVDRFIKLSHEVKSCTYNETEGKWHLKIQNPSGEIFSDVCDVLVMARGALNHASWPDIPGLDTFKGEVMHSAKWNESYDFKSKSIGIIGSGSSSIQILPSLQRLPNTQISAFIRSKTWISPPFGDSLASSLTLGPNSTFLPSQISSFNDSPAALQEFRMKIETAGNEIHDLTIRGTDLQIRAQKDFEAHMKERLSSKPEYYDWMKPDFAPGCRRLTPGPGYLEALTQPNVSFIRAPITHITKTGIVTSDGVHHDIDVLVCATGFHTAAAPPFPVSGLHNKTLATHWESRAETYLSLTTDGFPNLFFMLGPNSAIGSGSLTMMIESTGDYITKCIRKFQKENLHSLCIKQSRVADFIAYADAYFKNTVFTDECRSWYRKGDKITGLWPGSTLHCLEALRSPRWEDFDYVYKEGNRMAWLGNGWSVNQLEKRDLAWYLLPEFMHVPEAPLPEDNEVLKMRAFSH